MKSFAWLIAVVTGAACFNPQLSDRPFTCAPDGTCPPDFKCDRAVFICVRGDDGESPDGGSDPDAPPGFACPPGSFQSCRDDDTAKYCNADGNGYVDVDCPDGCETNP